MQIQSHIVKPVSFRTNPILWRKFKIRVYEQGIDITEFMTKFIEKFVNDEKFRQMILKEIGVIVDGFCSCVEGF